MNDLVILPLPIEAMPVIACQDRLLRPLNVNPNREFKSVKLFPILEVIGFVRS